MFKLFLEKEELNLITHAIYNNIRRIEYKIKEKECLKERYSKIISKLEETWSYIDSNKQETGIVVTHAILLDITESLFYRIEELNRLIIGNRTGGHPTNLYEDSKKELVDLYEKIMLNRLNNI